MFNNLDKQQYTNTCPTLTVTYLDDGDHVSLPRIFLLVVSPIRLFGAISDARKTLS
jgi:hypothetical protein